MEIIKQREVERVNELSDAHFQRASMTTLHVRYDVVMSTVQKDAEKHHFGLSKRDNEWSDRRAIYQISFDTSAKLPSHDASQHHRPRRAAVVSTWWRSS